VTLVRQVIYAMADTERISRPHETSALT